MEMSDTRCRRCGMTTEMSDHISGWCSAVKRSGIFRHNSLCKILGNEAQKQAWTVHREPVLEGPKGRLKPDLIFVKDEMALVVDPPWYGERDAACLVKAAEAKTNKYGCLRSQIQEEFDVQEARVFGLPVGARGGRTAQNDTVLKAGGIAAEETSRARTLRALGAQ